MIKDESRREETQSNVATPGRLKRDLCTCPFNQRNSFKGHTVTKPIQRTLTGSGCSVLGNLII